MVFLGLLMHPAKQLDLSVKGNQLDIENLNLQSGEANEQNSDLMTGPCAEVDIEMAAKHHADIHKDMKATKMKLFLAAVISLVVVILLSLAQVVLMLSTKATEVMLAMDLGIAFQLVAILSYASKKSLDIQRLCEGNLALQKQASNIRATLIQQKMEVMKQIDQFCFVLLVALVLKTIDILIIVIYFQFESALYFKLLRVLFPLSLCICFVFTIYLCHNLRKFFKAWTEFCTNLTQNV